MARIEKDFWIIQNIKRNCVWQGTRESPEFFTFQEATDELKRQTSKLPPEMTAKNWVITKHKMWLDDKKLSAVQAEEDFAKF